MKALLSLADEENLKRLQLKNVTFKDSINLKTAFPCLDRLSLDEVTKRTTVALLRISGQNLRELHLKNILWTSQKLVQEISTIKVREAAEKVPLLMVRPLRGGG